MDSANGNAKLIQDYLKGAKALEWNRYTLNRIGAALGEKLEEYTAQLSEVSSRIDELEKTVSAQKKQAEVSRLTAGSFVRAYILTAMVIAFITLFSGLIATKTGSGFLRFPFATWTRFVERSGYLVGALIYYILIPLAVSIVILFAVRLIRRTKGQSDAEAPDDGACAEELLTLRDEAEKIRNEKMAPVKEELDVNGKSVAKADEILEKYYGLDVIPEKYRSRIPVTVLEELFGTGRCSTLSGYDGALNVYDCEADAAGGKAVSDALDGADSDLKYLLESMSKESQLPRFYAYSENLSGRIFEHISSLDYPHRNIV